MPSGVPLGPPLLLEVSLLAFAGGPAQAHSTSSHGGAAMMEIIRGADLKTMEGSAEFFTRRTTPANG